MNLGNRIKSIRESKGMSQEELAKAVGYTSRSTINKIELGVNNPPLDKVIKIAEKLEVDPEVLLVKPPSAATLAAWEARQNPEGQLAQEVKLLEQIQSTYGKTIAEAFSMVSLLNEVGQDRMLEALREIVKHDEYRKE